MIHVGFSKGSSINIPLLHTIVAAQTRYGKSTTIRTMMQHVPDNYKVVCLDVKDPRDFQGAGTEIPIYIENKTDPLMLKQLLEQESHLWLRREFPELIDLCKEGDTFEQVLERVKERMKEKVHPVVRDRLKVLRLLLQKLVDNMAKVTISDTLELPGKNNVMNLSKTPGEIKQLAVYSVVKRVLENLANVILVIDELPDFAPQRYRTPSKQMIGQAIRKGGAKGIWLWLSGQTMTGVDKQVLKQAMIWILGHQREINEAKRTLDQIPFKTGLKVNDIMTLPVGHFIVCTDEGAYITYIQPEYVSDRVARDVSLGELPVKEIIRIHKESKEEDEKMWRENYLDLKEKYEEEKRKRLEAESRQVERLSDLKIEYDEEKRKRLELQKEFARQVERLSDLKAKERIEEARQKAFREARKKVDETKKLWNVDEMQKTIAQLKDEKTNLGKIVEKAQQDLAVLDDLKEVMGKLFPTVQAVSMPTASDVPSEVSVSVEQPALILKKKTEPLELSQNNVDGRIAIAYAEGLLEMKWFTKKKLNTTLEQRFGRKEAYPNLQKPLTNMTAWGYFEFHMAGPRKEWRVKLSPKDARQKGLLKEIEA